MHRVLIVTRNHLWLCLIDGMKQEIESAPLACLISLGSDPEFIRNV
jgi:hypothetical protein